MDGKAVLEIVVFGQGESIFRSNSLRKMFWHEGEKVQLFSPRLRGAA